MALVSYFKTLGYTKPRILKIKMTQWSIPYFLLDWYLIQQENKILYVT